MYSFLLQETYFVAAGYKTSMYLSFIPLGDFINSMGNKFQSNKKD